MPLAPLSDEELDALEPESVVIWGLSDEEMMARRAYDARADVCWHCRKDLPTDVLSHCASCRVARFCGREW